MNDEQNKVINYDTEVYTDGSEFYGKPTKAVPNPEKNIGIDTKGEFLDNIVDAGINSQLDIAAINSFTQISNNREIVMELLDTMSEDSTIAAVLEIYASDVTEMSDQGKIVWAVSDDANISKYINFLLDSMNIDKYIYKWVYSLCKYGDLYLRLYKKSEYKDALFDTENDEEGKTTLNEDVILKYYDKNDTYSHYVEMVPNPAEMFELTRLGKSYAYIKANINAKQKITGMMNVGTYRYSFNKSDVEVYDATNFVHAALEDNTSRIPEEVEIFINQDQLDSGDGLRYTVRRGQSLLYTTFKIWRELTLLENSLLLNRLTKSSIIRIIGVEVGDMPKESVGPHLVGIKQMIEQKSAIDVGNSLSEYTNPGPIENNIYVPTHNGIGQLSTQQIGGDVDVKGIADMDYFKQKLYTSLKVPKQYLGDTEDAAGFNGGTSLTLISSRYAKTIKRIQSVVIQTMTDLINLMLIDKKLDSYINKFTIKMQAPTTQEEQDRTASKGTQINMIQDVMNLIDGSDLPEDPSIKLKILKSMLSDVISDDEVITLIQEAIDDLESQEDIEEAVSDNDEDTDIDMDMDFNMPSSGGGLEPPDLDMETPNEENTQGETILPSPSELDAGDFTDLNNPEMQ